jgi:hypothetical protein
MLHIQNSPEEEAEISVALCSIYSDNQNVTTTPSAILFINQKFYFSSYVPN